MMFELWARYQGGEWELIDTCWRKERRDYLLGEYAIAFGTGWTFKVKEG